MKFFFILTCFIILLASCGNNSADKQEVKDDSADAGHVYSWAATLDDTTQRLLMVKVDTAGADSLTASSIIAFLNTKYPNVQLVFDKSSNDTLFVKIPEATYLTQQMGSTGPTMYLSTVVYNLTEIPGIRYVNFDLEEGDHAGPGTYGRDNFKDE